jgi:hypothetical protein
MRPRSSCAASDVIAQQHAGSDRPKASAFGFPRRQRHGEIKDAGPMGEEAIAVMLKEKARGA